MGQRVWKCGSNCIRHRGENEEQEDYGIAAKMGSCLLYLDDVLVLEKDVQEVIGRLSMVHQRLCHTGLNLKPTKYLFQVSFFGQCVSAKGIACECSKVEAVSH